MEVRLRSISRTIPWSLTLKAVVFGAAWLWLPFWLFLLLALGLYFVPLFHPGRLWWPFAAAIFFAALLTPSLWPAVFLAGLFFLILGIKDLIFIHRAAAYQALVFLLFALAYLNFFARTGRTGAPSLLLASLGLLLLVALLGGSLLRYGLEEEGRSPHDPLLLALLSFLLGAWALALAFLPLNFFFQSAILLLGAVSAFELVLAYRLHALSRREILLHLSVFFSFLVLALAGNTWMV